jgi:ribosomal protein S18 acetylase RimI-like enzyme
MWDGEFESWLPWIRAEYARGMSEHGGLPERIASEKAAADIAGLFPDGHASPDQSVFVIEADGMRVGELWVTTRSDGTHPAALWVFHVHVEEAHRGLGYGKAAMVLAEDEARRRGLDRVSLNVFGGNRIARRLYRSLGYDEAAVVMSKVVSEQRSGAT